MNVLIVSAMSFLTKISLYKNKKILSKHYILRLAIYDIFIMAFSTLLKSKTVDLDSLKRLLFQGGREQKKDSTAKSDKTPKSENKKNSSQRNRQSNSEKTKDCDVSISNYITNDGKTLNAQNEEEA